MTRDDIIRMAREAGFDEKWEHKPRFLAKILYFAELVASLVRADAIVDEREACAQVAGWLWQQFQDTKDAHERNSLAPFMPGQFGFDQSTVQQSKRMMDAIRARSNT